MMVAFVWLGLAHVLNVLSAAVSERVNANKWESESISSILQ